MYWKTLPDWFWKIYYLFLLMTLGTALFGVIRKKIRWLSVLAIVFVIIVPVDNILNSIGRAEGMNEFEHLVSQLEQGANWAIFSIIGHLFLLMFLLLWWIFFCLRKEIKAK